MIKRSDYVANSGLLVR